MGETAPHFQKNISTPPLQFIREMVCVNKKLKRIRSAERIGTRPLTPSTIRITCGAPSRGGMKSIMRTVPVSVSHSDSSTSDSPR